MTIGRVSMPAMLLTGLMVGTPAAAQPPAADPSGIRAELERLEALGERRAGFEARLRYTTVQGLLGEEQVRFGRLRQAGGDGQPGGDDAVLFRLDLDGEVVDGTLREMRRTLVWDGKTLLDANELTREARLRRVDGEEELAATLPLPLRIDADELLARYDVTRVVGDDAGPDAAVHLRLEPLDDPAADPLEVWFDAATGLPLRGRSGRPGGDTQAVDLTDPTPVDAFEAGVFDASPPAGNGWRVEGHAAEGSPAPPE